jgi:hypothetical protein
MTSRPLELGSLLERLVSDRRARVGGAIVGALVLGLSLAAGTMDVSHKRKRTTPLVTAPEVTPNIPLIRSWPFPRPMVEEARAEALRRPSMTGPTRLARR